MYLILFATALTALGLTILGTVATMFHFTIKRAPKPQHPRKEAITVIKPIRSGDELLLSNLESFGRLDFIDGDEILLCIDDANYFVKFTVEGFLENYAHVPIKICTANVNEWIANPKVRAISGAIDTAKNDLVIISDANVAVDSDYLDRLEAEHTDGVITSVIRGENFETIAGHLEAVYLNTFYARWMILSNILGHPCVVGKSMMFRRSQFAKVGLLTHLGNYLAEDYVTGRWFYGHGYDVKVATTTIRQQIGDYSILEFWNRHVRWGLIRKFTLMKAFLAEPLSYFLPSLVLGVTSVYHMQGLNMAISYGLFHLTSWALCDAFTMLAVGHEFDWHTPLVWLFRELMAVPLWIGILLSNSVTWHGRKYRIRRPGIIEFINKKEI